MGELQRTSKCSLPGASCAKVLVIGKNAEIKSQIRSVALAASDGFWFAMKTLAALTGMQGFCHFASTREQKNPVGTYLYCFTA